VLMRCFAAFVRQRPAELAELGAGDELKTNARVPQGSKAFGVEIGEASGAQVNSPWPRISHAVKGDGIGARRRSSRRKAAPGQS